MEEKQKSISEYLESINSMKKQKLSLEGQIQSLSNANSNLQTSVSSLSNDNSNLKQKISSLSYRISGLMYSSDLNTYDRRTYQLEEKYRYIINNINKLISNLENNNSRNINIRGNSITEKMNNLIKDQFNYLGDRIVGEMNLKNGLDSLYSVAVDIINDKNEKINNLKYNISSLKRLC